MFREHNLHEFLFYCFPSHSLCVLYAICCMMLQVRENINQIGKKKKKQQQQQQHYCQCLCCRKIFAALPKYSYLMLTTVHTAAQAMTTSNGSKEECWMVGIHRHTHRQKQIRDGTWIQAIMMKRVQMRRIKATFEANTSKPASKRREKKKKKTLLFLLCMLHCLISSSSIYLPFDSLIYSHISIFSAWAIACYLFISLNRWHRTE